jgi:hypothetical protein
VTRAPYDNEPLTKRERVAAMAMQGILSNPQHIEVFAKEAENFVQLSGQNVASVLSKLITMQSVEYADALLDRLSREDAPPAPTPDVEELCDE